jgi:hypothetical protein
MIHTYGYHKLNTNEDDLLKIAAKDEKKEVGYWAGQKARVRALAGKDKDANGFIQIKSQEAVKDTVTEGAKGLAVGAVGAGAAGAAAGAAKGIYDNKKNNAKSVMDKGKDVLIDQKDVIKDKKGIRVKPASAPRGLSGKAKMGAAIGAAGGAYVGGIIGNRKGEQKNIKKKGIDQSFFGLKTKMTDKAADKYLTGEEKKSVKKDK